MKSIVVYKTNEVPDELWGIIVNGFNDCFPNHKKKKEEFVYRYTSNPLGYCYHGLYYEDGILAGFNSITPSVYKIDGKDAILGLSGDTYVLPKFRKNMFIFMEIYNKQKAECAKDGIIAFLGVPNPNSYQYSIKLLRCKEISTVKFWILPIRIGNVIGKHRFLNPVSICFAWLSLALNKVLSYVINTQEEVKRVHIKISEDYLNSRLAAERYINVVDKTIRFAYTITNDEGVRCAYIMYFCDNFTRTYRALVKCVLYILRNERVDLIMFNGTLNLRQALLIKTPSKLEPRKLPFTVNLTDKKFQEEYGFLYNPEVWDFTLLNLDVR